MAVGKTLGLVVRAIHETSAMAQNFIGVDRDQVFLMSPSLRDWIAGDHLVVGSRRVRRDSAHRVIRSTEITFVLASPRDGLMLGPSPRRRLHWVCDVC